jgi:hypothetical protein
MSFEVLYRYKEKDSDGKFSEAVQEKTVKVGKPYEDTPLEEVAGKIIAQLARRNILVVEVEIYEYSKKKVSYLETDDGIKIKGRKFSFDNATALCEVGRASEEESPAQEQLMALLQSNPNLVQQLLGQVKNPNKPVAPAVNLAGPLRYEVFDPPDPAAIKMAAAQGLKLTKGKKYPIHQEKPAGPSITAGLLYVVTDDVGKQVPVRSEFFIIPPKLSEAFLEDSVQYVGGSGPEPKLSYGDEVASGMPDLSKLRGKK